MKVKLFGKLTNTAIFDFILTSTFLLELDKAVTAGFLHVTQTCAFVAAYYHGEIGCSKWKKTLAYLLVLPGSRARIVRCGGRYDPQLVKRSSE